ncbi:hypothetical protein ACEV7Z_23410, partial [Vibrio parahaemolyticus]
TLDNSNLDIEAGVRAAIAIVEAARAKRLKRDDIGLNRHRALDSCLSMIFSENRYALFRIML